MVAYSFKKRFGPPILAGTKGQTIRADRKRHARPGEELQLYTGMRTRQCQLLGRTPCLSVMPVRLCFSEQSATAPFEVGGAFLSWVEMEAFAKADGFEDIADMARFWWDEHPPKHGDTINFQGVLIRWQPLAPPPTADVHKNSEAAL
ncbi:hypothetical protein BV511_03020 [Methylorubrum extorquens]|uniref:hypothetical protein n=1 Tax=Methylorubrum extorquens TaxID=408 RepID=UPI000972E363|nr:hypothetical protein [Methylorubrum extorquens]APX83790.1 hypothetical protein BV511_03020 [Methylorubrum extorquens]